jgi:hypothetical protein
MNKELIQILAWAPHWQGGAVAIGASLRTMLSALGAIDPALRDWCEPEATLAESFAKSVHLDDLALTRLIEDHENRLPKGGLLGYALALWNGRDASEMVTMSLNWSMTEKWKSVFSVSLGRSGLPRAGFCSDENLREILRAIVVALDPTWGAVFSVGAGLGRDDTDARRFVGAETYVRVQPSELIGLPSAAAVREFGATGSLISLSNVSASSAAVANALVAQKLLP